MRRIPSLYSFLIAGLLLTGCASLSQPYPPPANPFLSGAPALEKAPLPAQNKAVLIWLAPQSSSAPSEAAQHALVEKFKSKFAQGQRLEIVGVTTILAPSGDALSEIRRASAPFHVSQALVVMPQYSEVVSPVWLQYGRDGRAIGTRTDSYVSVALVAVDLTTGSKLFSLVTNGEARLLAPDYEDARPWYPRISPGRTSAFIYPDGAAFPPGQVRAVALEDAVNGLIYQLDRAMGS